MIRVVRVAGESYDLETGDAIPKALVLSNGVREFPIYVDDDTAMAVIAMMAEAQETRNASTVSKVAQVPIPGTGKPQPVVVPESEPQVHQQVFEPERQPVTGPRMASVVDLPEEGDYEEEGAEPGEEYNDPATGVASL